MRKGKILSDFRVVATSSAVSLADVTLNAIVALMTGSTVMFSQALQGLSDLTTGGLLLTGVVRSRRVADKHYQFGYGREIFFWVLMAGLLMFLGTGFLSVYIGYSQFVDPGVVERPYIAIGMLLFGFATNCYALSLSIKRLRQSIPGVKWWWELRHSSIVETKATLLIDFLGTAAAAFGIIAMVLFLLTGDVRFDGAGSVAIGLTMMVASMYLIRDVRDLIVGRSVDERLVKKIIKITESVAHVNGVLDLRTMYLGSGKILIIVEVHVQENLDTTKIEKVIDMIKHEIHQAIPEAHYIQVEIETPDGEFHEV